MPITPLHALAPMFLYFRDRRGFDPLALAVSSTFIDLEAAYYLLLMEPLNHRLLHSFALTLIIYPILTTLGVYIVERLFTEKLQGIYNKLRFKTSHVQYPISTIYFCSLIGSFTHIFFDMFTHKDMPYVLYLIAYGNPFYLGTAAIVVELAVILLALYSCLVWLKTAKLKNH
ncbi:MAG: DUF4184 family protein [Candidatus Bathyarchaeales archaeon]